MPLVGEQNVTDLLLDTRLKREQNTAGESTISGRGEMAERVRAFDWASTPLGRPEQWPQSLRVAVGICLNSRFPMFVWWGPQLINIYNDGYVPMLGKKHPAALGKPAEPTWKEIWDVVGKQAEAVMQRGEATWNERVLLMLERHGYSEETWFTWSYSPIPDEKGGIGGLFCAVTEDTPRVIAERERDRLAEQRQLALDAAAMGWWHYDPQTRISMWDERYAEIFGVSGSGSHNDEILKLLHPDDLPVVWAKVEAALDPKKAQPFYAEYRVNRQDGTMRWVEAHGVVSFAGEGAARKAINFVGTVADVTERKSAESERERLAAVVRNSPDFIGIATLDGKPIFVNPTAIRMAGVDEATALNTPVIEYFAPKDQARVRDEVIPAVLADGHWVGELELQNLKTGEPYPVLYDIFRIDDPASGKPMFIATITREISAQKKAEAALRAATAEAEAANKAKDKFLAVLSHELRTPLSPVLLSVAAMAIDEDLPYKFREDMAMIRRNIDLETKLIDDLLDLSRITSGKLRLGMQPTGAHDLLRHVVRSSVSDMPEKKLNLDVQFEARDDRINADPARLQQVFWNLLRNAAKFTPDGGRIVIRTWNDADTDEFYVQISDNGEGIDSRLLPKIFDAFEQGDARMTRQFGGLGLGLAIAKAVVEMHGGGISATSDGKGHGATFTVRLGRPVPEDATDGRPESNQAGGRERRSVRILLVEDHPDTARTLSRLLVTIGYKVKVANDAAAALQLAETDSFDMVISDIGLPDSTGHDLMRQLKSRHGLRGVALTGYGMEEDMRNSREAGFLDHVVKPIDINQLEVVIQRVVAKEQ